MDGRLRGKKGIFFTIISIALLAIVVYSFVVYTYSMTNKALVIQTRVESMNSFVKDIDRDIERGFYISSFRSILGMKQYVIDNGTFIVNAEDRFVEVFQNGTINETYLIITRDNLFSDWVFKMWERGHKIGIDVNVTVNGVSITQTSPWEINAYLDSTIIITDKKKTSKWEKRKTVITKIPIEGLEDPLYTVKLALRASNMIRRSPYIGNYTNGANIDNLKNHLNGTANYLVGSYYQASDNGPGFLDRLEGRTSLYRPGSGIESFCNKQKYIDILGGLDAEYYYKTGKSSLDYIQFGPDNPANFNVSGMPTWFKVDNTSNKLDSYNITHLALKN